MTPGWPDTSMWFLYGPNHAKLYPRQLKGTIFEDNTADTKTRQRYGYELHGNFDTSHPPDWVVVRLKRPTSGEIINTWVFEGFQNEGQNT